MYGVLVEVEQGGAEEPGPLPEDLGRPRAGVRRRGVVEGRHFGKGGGILLSGECLGLGQSRQTPVSCHGRKPSQEKPLHRHRPFLRSARYVSESGYTSFPKWATKIFGRAGASPLSSRTPSLHARGDAGGGGGH